MTPPRSRPKARVGARLADALLTLLSLFGVVCIAGVAAAWFFGVNIMLFKTGSMSPTIPAGSVSLVRAIPAAEAEIGDVVTVARGEGELPVTHRVLSNEPDPLNGPDGRIIEMQGDANPQPDSEPYHVAEVKRVFWSVPGGGGVIVWLSQPWVLGGVTLLAGALVAWAFWPREDTPEKE